MQRDLYMVCLDIFYLPLHGKGPLYSNSLQISVAIKTLSRRFEGSTKAVLGRYSGSIKTLLYIRV
jgi:hypothetical protein